MVRTQIQLDETTYKEIKKIAYQQGKSMAEIIRVVVDRGLKTGAKTEKKLSLADFKIIGKYRSKKKNISENHDDYLAEDFK